VDLRSLIATIIFYAPTLVAGVIGLCLGLQCRRALTAFLTALLVTVLLAISLAAGLERLSSGVQQDSPNTRGWLFHLKISPILGVPAGLFCAIWVAGRPPPTIQG
jgi:hypothetical protein